MVPGSPRQVQDYKKVQFPGRDKSSLAFKGFNLFLLIPLGKQYDACMNGNLASYI